MSANCWVSFHKNIGYIYLIYSDQANDLFAAMQFNDKIKINSNAGLIFALVNLKCIPKDIICTWIECKKQQEVSAVN